MLEDFADTVYEIGGAGDIPDSVGRKRERESADTVCGVSTRPPREAIPGPCLGPPRRSLPPHLVPLRAPDGGRKAAGAGKIGAGVTNVLIASAELEPSEVQDLGDIMPDLLKIKVRANTPIRFHVRIELGDGKTLPSQKTANELNEILKKVKEEFRLR